MPESPDFDAIARDLLPLCLRVKYSGDVPEACGLIAEQLRLVWNARGAADIAKVEATLYADGTSRMGFDKMLDQAIRSVDR